MLANNDKTVNLSQMIFKTLIAILLTTTTVSSVYAQTYITNVTIADVENLELVPNQTILITKDLISDIQPNDKIKIPKNATVIDGTGKYIIPGMTDAHVHFFQNGGLYTRPDVIDLRSEVAYRKEIDYAYQNIEKTLRRYLQNGITNVIDVGATYGLLRKREQYADSNSTPTVHMTGPLLTTYEPSVYLGLEEHEPFNLVTSVEDGIAMVKKQLPLNPDFIKIWYIVGAEGLGVEASAKKKLPIIKAIIDEAHRNKLKVAVHATQRITAQLAVENGCDFLVHSVNDEIIENDFVQLLKKSKTILCPTLIVHKGYQNAFGQKIVPNDLELLTADPFQLGTLLDLKHLSDTLLTNKYKNISNSSSQVNHLNKADSISLTNLKILSDAGVLIATGTDAGNIGTLHASSYLAELRAMSKSGMTNWQILQASTINGALVLDKEAQFGSVKKGKKANLVLLDANPIDNIGNISKINLVINNGIVFKPSSLIKETPSALVQRQLNAYNFRNIEAFLEPYADDVEVYAYPDKLLYLGKEKMRSRYSQMFKNTPNLHCELKARIVQDNIVIDKERVQFGKKMIEATAIYHIENNKIQKVYFIQ